MTGVAFLSFSAGGLMATITIFPLISLCSRGERRQVLTRDAIRQLFRLFVRSLEFLGVLSFKCNDRECLERSTGSILAANHPTLIDVVLIMSIVRNAQCVVKPSLWKNFFLGGVVRAAGYLRSDAPPENLVTDCVASLRAGENLIIFPQGTRTPPGVEMRMHRGLAHIAFSSGADVQLLLIHCRPGTLRKGDHWYEIPDKKPAFSLIVGDRLDTHYYLSYPLRHTGAQRMIDAIGAYFSEYVPDGPIES
jgi:1-acyl-sn-glycerol-3-phosphate acyltransferase